MTRPSPYQWIIDRARSGEPVPIDTTRRDISRVIDFLLAVDGRGLAIQSDNTVNLLWVVKAEGRSSIPRPHVPLPGQCELFDAEVTG